MLLALRSLFETVTPVVVPPVGFGGGGGQVHHLPQFPTHKVSIAAEVTLRSARGKFRAGKLTASGGGTAGIHPARATFTVNPFPSSGAANTDLLSAKGKFRAGKIEGFGIENDEAIIAAILEL